MLEISGHGRDVYAFPSGLGDSGLLVCMALKRALGRAQAWRCSRSS